MVNKHKGDRHFPLAVWHSVLPAITLRFRTFAHVYIVVELVVVLLLYNVFGLIAQRYVTRGFSFSISCTFTTVNVLKALTQL